VLRRGTPRHRQAPDRAARAIVRAAFATLDPRAAGADGDASRAEATGRAEPWPIRCLAPDRPRAED